MAWLSYTWWNPRIRLPEEADEDDIEFVLHGDIQKEYNSHMEDMIFWEKEQDNNLLHYHVDLDNLPEDITFKQQ